MKPKILILSASSGAGHVRAGQALEKAFAARGDCAVEHVDALDYTSKLFQRIYDDAYIGLVRRAPALMGWIYDQFDKAWKHQSRRLALDRLNTGPMVKMLEKVRPDVCIATHFLPAEIIAWLKAKRKFGAALAIGITDFDVHAMWLCRTVDRYYVALDETAEYLRAIGVPAPVKVTGIPVDPIFAEAKDRREVRRKHGLDPERTTLLVSAGGYAVGPVEKLVSDLLALDRPWEIVAVAGKAEATKKRLEQLAARSRGPARLHAVGFTKEMDEWMAASDLLVGKAGGLTCSEALACGLPMALIEPIPGQEERNADHLLERGAAIRCNNLPVAAWKIGNLLDDPERLDRMRSVARAMGRPNAAAEIAADALDLFSKKR